MRWRVSGRYGWTRYYLEFAIDTIGMFLFFLKIAGFLASTHPTQFFFIICEAACFKNKNMQN